MSKKISRKLFSILFFFGVLIVSFWYIFHDENLSQVLRFLRTADPCYVISSVGAVVAFILGESVVICYLLKKLGAKARFSHCALYSFIGFFYSSVTPSASGGQPMQVVAMRQDGISGAVATVVLAIVTITYKLVLVILGIAVLIFRPASIITYLDDVEPLMYIGLTLNVAFIIFLLTVVFHPSVIRRGAEMLFAFIHRIRPFRNLESASAKLDHFLNGYNGTATFFKDNPRIIVHVLLITFIQRFCLFSVVWFTYEAFGISGQNPFVMMMLYAMISVAVDMLPLPGGMGISETLFLSIFEPIFGAALVLPGMIVCRGISYYTQLLISAIMTAVSSFIFKDKE